MLPSKLNDCKRPNVTTKYLLILSKYITGEWNHKNANTSSELLTLKILKTNKENWSRKIVMEIINPFFHELHKPIVPFGFAVWLKCIWNIECAESPPYTVCEPYN